MTLARAFVFALLSFLPVAGGAAAQTSKTDDYRDQIAATVDGVVKSKLADSNKEPSYSMSLQTGVMSYTQGGFDGRSETNETEISLESGFNASNFAAQWEWFHRKNLATFMGYRLAYNPKIKRTQYQAGFGGVRYYLYTPGIPINGQKEFTSYQYNAKFKPYVAAGLSSGRYLARVFGEKAALDVSSEFYGAMVGIGAQVPVTAQTAAGLDITYEYAKGYGPLLFNASTFFGLFGLYYYY